MPSNRHDPASLPPTDRQQWESEYESWCRELDAQEFDSINRLLNEAENERDS